MRKRPEGSVGFASGLRTVADLRARLRVSTVLGMLFLFVRLTGAELAAAPQSASDTAAAVRVFQQQCASCHGSDGKGTRSAGTPDFTNAQFQASHNAAGIAAVVRTGKPGTAMQGFSGRLSDAEIVAVAGLVQSLATSGPLQSAAQAAGVYEAADDYLYILPTGRRPERGGLYLNFTHRFAYDPAFEGRARGSMLLGLDGFSVSSFGLRYGVTDKISVSAFRSPSIIGRPVELMAAYHPLDELDGHPVNAAVRVSVDGQDHFRNNFTVNFEAIVSRSIKTHAQLYVVPTFSLDQRRLVSKPGSLEGRVPNAPGFNTFSLGVGGAFNLRPTLAFVAEVIPTLSNARELGIHRPSYGFGIQKRVRRHAFTLGFSTSPGSIVSQRPGTRATFVGNPSADKPGGLFIGFDLMRQLR